MHLKSLLGLLRRTWMHQHQRQISTNMCLVDHRLFGVTETFMIVQHASVVWMFQPSEVHFSPLTHRKTLTTSLRIFHHLRFGKLLCFGSTRVIWPDQHTRTHKHTYMHWHVCWHTLVMCVWVCSDVMPNIDMLLNQPKLNPISLRDLMIINILPRIANIKKGSTHEAPDGTL